MQLILLGPYIMCNMQFLSTKEFQRLKEYTRKHCSTPNEAHEYESPEEAFKSLLLRDWVESLAVGDPDSGGIVTFPTEGDFVSGKEFNESDLSAVIGRKMHGPDFSVSGHYWKYRFPEILIMKGDGNFLAIKKAVVTKRRRSRRGYRGLRNHIYTNWTEFTEVQVAYDLDISENGFDPTRLTFDVFRFGDIEGSSDPDPIPILQQVAYDGIRLQYDYCRFGPPVDHWQVWTISQLQ